jgi:hypothetical protein
MSNGFLPINLANVQPATGFDYPPGLYMFQVEGTEVRTNNDGSGQRLLVNNSIVVGPGPSTQFQGRKLANSYQLSEKGAPFLKRFFMSCGITEEFIAQNGGNVQAEWLHGRQYVAQIVKQGNYTNITNERPLAEWDAAMKAGGGNSGQVQQASQGQSPAAQPSLLQPVQAPPAMQAPPMQMPQQMQPQMQQPQMPQPQYQQPQMGLPQPAAQVPQAGLPMGIPAPAPPPGRVGQ